MSASLSGAREAQPSWLRRLVARAAARELSAFVVPAPELARARGLDLEASGLTVVGTPRHARVLVVVGELPEGLKKAAAVAYAQMPRPRAILAVGAGDVSPLPEPNVSVGLAREGVSGGVAELRRTFAEGAFGAQTADFDVEAIRTQTEYVCPMHPEVVRGEPGSCPICGMDLVPREATGGMGHGDDHGRAEQADHADHAAHHGEEGTHHSANGDTGGREHSHAEDEVAAEYTCPMHPEVARGEPGACPACGMDLVRRAGDAKGTDQDGGQAGDGGPAEYICPMHPEVTADEPGSCPKCGMDLVPREEAGEEEGSAGEDAGHEGHGEGSGGHDEMGHGDGMGFMSMVEMTKDLPRSSDGLQMEWVETPFGPLFPGLPGGLSLTFTLDGDTVARAEAEPGIEGWAPAEGLAGPVETFPDRLARLDPLSPVAYRVLACKAVEDAAGAAGEEGSGRAGALERERAASHLGWLSQFGHLLGDRWVARHAAELQLALLRAEDAGEVVRLEAGIRKFVRRVERAPLLRRRLRGIGVPPGDAEASGPVARAAGRADDARADDTVYLGLGFAPVLREGNDALSRLRVRLAEIAQSLELVRAAGSISAPDRPPDPASSGTGTAAVETPRGRATLSLILEGGTVVAFDLDTPSTEHLDLVEPLAEGEELADALVGVSSLDLSPWEVIG